MFRLHNNARSISATRTLTHSLPVMPTDTQGSNKEPVQLSVPSQLLDGVPAEAQAPHLCLNSVSQDQF